ncbi:MAG: iron-sulfur cluster repair di-iron protein [Chitinophagaceae bacterium]
MKELMIKSLGEIVNMDYRTASVFEKYKFDFCCKGKRTLEQACLESGQPEEGIVKELSVILDVPKISSGNPGNLSPTLLAEYIVTVHHAYVKKEMPRILAYLDKVVSKHGDQHPEIKKIALLFTELSVEMDLHMNKEEYVLFPRIAKVEKQILSQEDSDKGIFYLKSPVMIMEQEHDHAGTIMAQIRELTNNYSVPANACTTYRLLFSCLEMFEADLHRHVHLENNLLFPKALKLLGSVSSDSHMSN